MQLVVLTIENGDLRPDSAPVADLVIQLDLQVVIRVVDVFIIFEVIEIGEGDDIQVAVIVGIETAVAQCDLHIIQPESGGGIHKTLSPPVPVPDILHHQVAEKSAVDDIEILEAIAVEIEEAPVPSPPGICNSI